MSTLMRLLILIGIAKYGYNSFVLATIMSYVNRHIHITRKQLYTYIQSVMVSVRAAWAACTMSRSRSLRALTLGISVGKEFYYRPTV